MASIMLTNVVSRLPVVQTVHRTACVHCMSAQRSTGPGLLERPVARQRIQSLILSNHSPNSVANSAPLQSQRSHLNFELSVLIDVLPARVRTSLQQHPNVSQLVEVVLDLGRPVLARFADTHQQLSAAPLARHELEEVTNMASAAPASKQQGIDVTLPAS